QEVAAMNPENFLVRLQLDTVEPFQQADAWNTLNDDHQAALKQKVAGLPSSLETDKLESRLFDLTVLQMQLALLEENQAEFERRRQRVLEISLLLEEKTTIPAIATQLKYLTSLQEEMFWEDITLDQLEELRLRLRGLTPFLDKQKRSIVYTNFKDKIMGVREQAAVYLPKMTGIQYEKKVKDYLRNHLNQIVIHKLRTNQPLTQTDLDSLEKTLTEIGEEDGASLLSGLLERNESPSLPYLIRNFVGMDRAAAQAAFSDFLGDRSLTASQIRFIEMIIDQLTARGIMEASALYEPPFSNLHAGGPDALFSGKENVIDAVFQTLVTLKPQVQDRAS
ncbi:MAG: type I restriction-modification enzyme R subunit C-terminal domain-containing protein, partial [Synechocystis sp.]